MTPLERFDAFLKSKVPDQYGYTIEKVVKKAEELGLTRDDVRVACKQIRHWLSINEDSPKANKKHWGKFILNWLKPKSRRKCRRLAPGKFEGESRIIE